MTGSLFDPGPAAARPAPADGISRRAALSPCGTYRYALWREDLLEPDDLVVDDQMLFVMLNPSTADHEVDDRTIGRCIGFARREHFNRLAVANLYALRSTDPARLAEHPDPVGPENDDWILNLALESAEIVVAWGACRLADDDRIAQVLGLLAQADEIKCLGTTAAGAPRHPLYLPADQQLELYEVLP